MNYICDICGFVYSEEKESTNFKDLPEDWVCPICGATKKSFSKD